MEYVRERHPAERHVDALLANPNAFVVVDVGAVILLSDDEAEAHRVARQRRDAYKPQFKHLVLVLSAEAVAIKEEDEL